MNGTFGAVIPAFNESRHIRAVIEETARFIPVSNIVIVDDGSADGTADEARSAGADVLVNTVNSGKGASLLRGFEALLERGGIEGIFTLDADGQHDPSEMMRFIEEYRRSGAEIVIGSRMGRLAGMPAIRRITNRLTSWIISVRAGQRVEDSQSGYRLISSDLLGRIEIESTRFDMESEILIKSAAAGARIAAVPITTIYGEEKSKIHPVRDTVRFLRLVWRSFFW